MTILASLAYGNNGDSVYGPHLTIWNDDTRLWHFPLPAPDWPIFGGGVSIEISSDGKFVCIARNHYSTSSARVYSVETGTYVAVPQLKNLYTYGPSFGVITWSPTGLFISGAGDYAYNPYTNTLIPLPGPSAAAMVPGEFGLEFEGLSVLAAEGLLLEAQPADSPDDPGTYPLVVKDLFTGLPVPAPAGLADFFRSGARPCTWHDDTGVRGILYKSISYENPLDGTQNAYRILNLNTGQVDVRPTTLNWPIGKLPFKNGFVLNVGGTGYGYPDQTPAALLGQDDGTFHQVPFYPGNGSGCRNINIFFEYNNTIFAGDSLTTTSGTPLTGVSTIGAAVPSSPPLFTYTPGPWLGFSGTISAIQSPKIYRTPKGLDGRFWVNRQYAGEAIL